MENFGTVQFEGKTITQTEDAYPNLGAQGFTVYQAAAEDEEGNEYKIIWQTKEGFEDHKFVENEDRQMFCCICGEGGCIFENSEDCCDWEEYEVSKL